MKPAMLDTDILSEFFRGDENVLRHVERYLRKYSLITVSVITYYEVLNGLLYKDAKKQLRRFHEFIEINEVIPLSIHSAEIAANIQAELRRKGVEIGHTDTLIAGIAIENNRELITNNIRHFKRIKALKVSNWMKEFSE
jgi:tRNA(fMet)-specific endonuclease VapC